MDQPHVPFSAIAFSEAYAADDGVLATKLLAEIPLPRDAEARIDERTRDLVAAIRACGSSLGGIEDLLREYSLSTSQGLALMVLAETLLRVPDQTTADALLEDKLASGDFVSHQTASHAPLVTVSDWALKTASHLLRPEQALDGIIVQTTRRLGSPAVLAAMRRAVHLMGSHFVLGQTIEEALRRVQTSEGDRYSFDMLGEGARTASDAQRHFESYGHAIGKIGAAAGHRSLPDRPGISVKLSALHPRYEAVNRDRVVAELAPRLLELARCAKRHDLNLTIDAEEADRLELSLDVIAHTLRDSSLAGWDGFGLAIQAYQKRASAVIRWIGDLASAHGRRLMVRLVKGAYWDTEIKRAQERGLDDYPVFTRKAMTDANYLACAKQLLAARTLLFPQFATHNALTVSTIIEHASTTNGYEFQRLYGMGETLYRRLTAITPGVACRVYAPVGGHRDLLAYLVRRLLENGANSSFVSAAADPAVPIEKLLIRPVTQIGHAENARHKQLPRPADLFDPERRNSAGIELGHRASLTTLLGEIRAAAAAPASAAPLIDGHRRAGEEHPIFNPSDVTTVVGTVADACPDTVGCAVRAAAEGFEVWSCTPAEVRAAALERAADLIEARRARFIHLLRAEAGKTIDDAISEVREAVDFCRYYAAQGRELFGKAKALPGPTGESNTLSLRGRGVFVAISPWNFPLAIFIGQIAAALMAGNSVVAKPAEQTPLIADEAICLLHDAGIATSALHVLPGDGGIGASLVQHPRVAGVVFTGSMEVARDINRALAAKDGPITPLIAETGGLNAMIVDATALPEQVADDVITSAFRSAGQRCSALRLLFVQDDVADRMIEMIVGAARELRIGCPSCPDTDIGPVIDTAAKTRLEAHIAHMKSFARVHFAGVAPSAGHFVAPHIFELTEAGELTREVFGPILHIVRYRPSQLAAVLGALRATGYGLTFGLHSRIDSRIRQLAPKLAIGNVYVNRNIVGAVVGAQPFGGQGLSGTGPKAGGPNYLIRFATEQTLTINTAAVGGNVGLLSENGDA